MNLDKIYKFILTSCDYMKYIKLSFLALGLVLSSIYIHNRTEDQKSIHLDTQNVKKMIDNDTKDKNLLHVEQSLFLAEELSGFDSHDSSDRIRVAEPDYEEVDPKGTHLVADESNVSILANGEYADQVNLSSIKGECQNNCNSILGVEPKLSDEYADQINPGILNAQAESYGLDLDQGIILPDDVPPDSHPPTETGAYIDPPID